jgi:hypothetical protein
MSSLSKVAMRSYVCLDVAMKETAIRTSEIEVIPSS